MTLTRGDITTALQNLGLAEKRAKAVVDAFFDAMTRALREGRKVSIVGFGKWFWRDQPGRKARNPKSGILLSLLPRKTLAFKPSPLLKAKINASR